MEPIPFSILPTAYKSQVDSLTGETGGRTPTPTKRRVQFFSRLETIIPKLRAEVDRAQKRCKRNFRKKVRIAKHVLKPGDSKLTNSHTRTGGKPLFQTKGAHHVLGTDERRFTIERNDGICTVNGQDVVNACSNMEDRIATLF